MKRRSELENLCRLAHIEPDTSTSLEKSTALIDSGKKKNTNQSFMLSSQLVLLLMILTFLQG